MLPRRRRLPRLPLLLRSPRLPSKVNRKKEKIDDGTLTRASPWLRPILEFGGLVSTEWNRKTSFFYSIFKELRHRLGKCANYTSQVDFANGNGQGGQPDQDHIRWLCLLGTSVLDRQTVWTIKILKLVTIHSIDI
jgi:hypothetical protein